MGVLKKIAVVGGGSWATALVKILSDSPNNPGSRISWWVRKEETAAYIRENRHNPNYLSAVSHDLSRIDVSTDLEAVISDAELLILAIPSAFLHEQLKGISPEPFRKTLIASAIKGIVPETNQLVGEYIADRMQVPESHLLVISGPCHAEEVALEKLSYLTIAGSSEEHARTLASALECRYLKTTLSNDFTGTEYAAVLKNIYAIASGVCHGLGYGDNFQAVLISNAAREMKRFIDKVYPMHRDVTETAYLGDLLVTAYSQFSRNRTFGNMLGKGYSVKAAQVEMNMIAEGYYATNCLHQINTQHGVDLPILESVYRIIYGHENAREVVRGLGDRLS